MAMYLALFSKGIVATISACITLFSTVMSNINRNFKVNPYCRVKYQSISNFQSTKFSCKLYTNYLFFLFYFSFHYYSQGNRHVTIKFVSVE